MKSQMVDMVLLMFAECFGLFFITSFSILVQLTKETIIFKNKKEYLRIDNKILKIFTYTIEDERHSHGFSLHYCLNKKIKVASCIIFKPLL